MNLTTIRQELSAAAEAVDARLTGYPFIPDSVNPPAVVIDVPDYRPIGMQRGFFNLSFRVLLVVSTTWDQAAQEFIDQVVPLMFTGLETDRTLNGAAQSVDVQQFTPRDRIDVAEFSYVGGQFDVEVVAT